MIKHFVIWVDVPVEAATHATVSRYIDYLMKKLLASDRYNAIWMAFASSTIT